MSLRPIMLLASSCVAAACAPAGPAIEPAQPVAPTVVISSGVRPTLTPADVESLAMEFAARVNADRIASPLGGRVVTMTAIHGGYWIGPHEEGVTWIVEVAGDFVERLGWGEPAAIPAHGLRLLISDFDPRQVSVAWVR